MARQWYAHGAQASHPSGNVIEHARLNDCQPLSQRIAAGMWCSGTVCVAPSVSDSDIGSHAKVMPR